jgi:hypothetical protein
MNNLLLINLAADFVSDRFPDEDVFVKTTNHTALVLHGASHLRNMARFFDTQELQVFDLATQGLRIYEYNMQTKTSEITKLGEQIDLEKVTVIRQLYDNIIYLVGGAGSIKCLLVRDADGLYHVNGKPVVADKATIKDLSGKLVPLIWALCRA